MVVWSTIIDHSCGEDKIASSTQRLRRSTMEHVPYVIIGGGLAGVAAADTIRRRERNAQIILICAEPHPPSDRVPLSKGYLLGEIERDQVFLRPERHYERNKVELVLGQPVTALDLTTRQVTLADGRQIGYEKLLLATGGRPRRLPIPGADLTGIYYLRNLEHSA